MVGSLDKGFFNGLTTKPIEVYPSKADPILIVSGNVTWGVGSWVEIVPANTITSRFAILGVIVDPGSLGSERRYEVDLGKGAAGAETVIATVYNKWEYVTAAGRRPIAQPIMFPIPLEVEANSRIAARAADNTTSTLNYRVKIIYVELPWK